jgi:hypothetical protein
VAALSISRRPFVPGDLGSQHRLNGSEIMRSLTKEETRAILELAREFGIDRHGLATIQRYFIYAVGRIMLKDWRRQDAVDPDFMEVNGRTHQIGDQVNFGVIERSEAMKWTRRTHVYMRMHEADIRHVVDWLWIAATECHPWTADLDEHGRPKKLLKPGSISELRRYADRELARRPKPRLTHELTEADQQTVMDLGDGYTLVRLLTPAALDAETLAMDHCIGQGSYDWKLNTERRYKFFSVRDETGQSRATLEVHGVVIEQWVGFRNGPLEDHVQNKLDDAAKALKWIDPEAWEESIAQVLREDVARRQLG